MCGGSGSYNTPTFKAPEIFKADKPPKKLQIVESILFMSIILSKMFFLGKIQNETKQVGEKETDTQLLLYRSWIAYKNILLTEEQECNRQ